MPQQAKGLPVRKRKALWYHIGIAVQCEKTQVISIMYYGDLTFGYHFVCGYTPESQDFYYIHHTVRIDPFADPFFYEDSFLRIPQAFTYRRFFLCDDHDH